MGSSAHLARPKRATAERRPWAQLKQRDTRGLAGEIGGALASKLQVTEIKAFVPARDFERSKQFYRDLGFTMASEGDGVACFHFMHASFLLQDFCAEGQVESFMMHLLVDDVQAWWEHVKASGVEAGHGVRVTEIETQPWRMKDFCLFDPSGVLWRIGQNID